MKEYTIGGIVSVALIGVALLLERGCNNLFNNRRVNNPGYTLYSYATGISGHVEYIRYSNHSQDVKIYPGWSHRLFDSQLIQDLNGDGKADLIRQHGSELVVHRLDELLIREIDYEMHRERFDEADAQLQRLMKTYPPHSE